MYESNVNATCVTSDITTLTVHKTSSLQRCRSTATSPTQWRNPTDRSSFWSGTVNHIKTFQENKNREISLQLTVSSTYSLSSTQGPRVKESRAQGLALTGWLKKSLLHLYLINIIVIIIMNNNIIVFLLRYILSTNALTWTNLATQTDSDSKQKQKLPLWLTACFLVDGKQEFRCLPHRAETFHLVLESGTQAETTSVSKSWSWTFGPPGFPEQSRDHLAWISFLQRRLAVVNLPAQHAKLMRHSGFGKPIPWHFPFIKFQELKWKRENKSGCGPLSVFFFFHVRVCARNWRSRASAL